MPPSQPVFGNVDSLAPAQLPSAPGAGHEAAPTPWEQFAWSQAQGFQPTPFGGFDLTNAGQDQQFQNQLLQQLHQQANGDPNSLAQQQLGQSYQHAQGQALSGQAAIRGQGAGAGMRQAGWQQGDLQAQHAQASHMLMVQQQQQALAQLAALYGQQQGQNVGLANDLGQAGVQNNALNGAMGQFWGGQAVQGALEQMSGQSQVAAANFKQNLSSQAMWNQFVNQGMNAIATGAEAYSNLNNQPKPGYAQAWVDAAFNRPT